MLKATLPALSIDENYIKTAFRGVNKVAFQNKPVDCSCIISVCQEDTLEEVADRLRNKRVFSKVLIVEIIDDESLYEEQPEEDDFELAPYYVDGKLVDESQRRDVDLEDGFDDKTCYAFLKEKVRRLNNPEEEAKLIKEINEFTTNAKSKIGETSGENAKAGTSFMSANTVAINAESEADRISEQENTNSGTSCINANRATINAESKIGHMSGNLNAGTSCKNRDTATVNTESNTSAKEEGNVTNTSVTTNAESEIEHEPSEVRIQVHV